MHTQVWGGARLWVSWEYIDKMQNNLLHLSKTTPKKFWRQILTRKTKNIRRILLHDWNSYLKKLYESSNVINNFETLLTMVEFFSLEDIDFGVKRMANGKAKDIEGYQAEILKIGGPVLIPHIHKLFNQAVSLGLRASLSLFLKVGIQKTPQIIRLLWLDPS